eukprot:TRINITY_DN66741_c0_g1_i1.p1 TRINITY_DN66741_c0_g1~~TRINITY_DN66741_c0_g1_i1.p1  ORF type:complete len:254 (+),score=29.21 TRINITY_DN66741_c0_g1_i1:37-762(+)
MVVPSVDSSETLRTRSRSPPPKGKAPPCEPFHLAFLTTNDGKFESLRLCAQHLISSQQLVLEKVADIELPETQADDIETVAAAKARAAWKMLGRPVVVQDSGLVIEALSDFPGPYTKYVVGKIGIEGLLRLMQGRQGDERRCGFDHCVAFCDADGQVHCFHEPSRYWGRLAEAPALALSDGGHPAEGRELFRVFIPCDDAAPRQVPLAEFTPEELASYRKSRPSAFRSFLDWLSTRLSQAK